MTIYIHRFDSTHVPYAARPPPFDESFFISLFISIYIRHQLVFWVPPLGWEVGQEGRKAGQGRKGRKDRKRLASGGASVVDYSLGRVYIQIDAFFATYYLVFSTIS
jgi:hypothetical protein